MTTVKAAELDPSFQHKSENTKGQLIRRLLAAHGLAIKWNSLISTTGSTEQVAAAETSVQMVEATAHPKLAGPKVFHAQQFMVDDAKSPVLSPDFIEEIQFTSAEEARRSEVQGDPIRQWNEA